MLKPPILDDREPWADTVWMARVDILRTYLQIIRAQADGSEDPTMQWLANQALAGIRAADHYMQNARQPASRIEARSGETAQPVRPEGREPGGEAETPNPSIPSVEE